MFRTATTLRALAAAIVAATVIAACGSSSPSSSSSSVSSSSGGPPTPAQRQQMEQAAVRFADCMRSHGVPDFPDPSTSPREYKNAFETKSPAFHSGESACEHLLPGGGPRSNAAPQPSQAQMAAELAFARCLRSHGFPSFPDPTSSGQLSHEMLASAGIDIHQPAALRAADSCVGVTHGFLTKAAVARFVAGNQIAIEAFGTRVAMARLAPDPPSLLFAGHLEGDQPVLVYRVGDLDEALAELRERRVEVGVGFEIPHGRGVEITNPGPQRVAVYERTRPHADERLAGRRDF